MKQCICDEPSINLSAKGDIEFYWENRKIYCTLSSDDSRLLVDTTKNPEIGFAELHNPIALQCLSEEDVEFHAYEADRVEDFLLLIGAALSE